MIICAQPFFNELDLLEVKLHELADSVDRFVIVEAFTTFTGVPKRLYFHENRDRFAHFEDKIIHRAVTLPELARSPWDREAAQYEAVRATVRALDPDVAIFCDADEIPRADTVDRFLASGHLAASLEMDKLLFGFDRIDTSECWRNAKIGRRGCGTLWRGTEGLPVLPDAGWHCEYFGTRDELLAKLSAVSHAPEEGCTNMRRLVSLGQLPGMERTAAYDFAKLPQLVRKLPSDFESHFIDPPTMKADKLFPADRYANATPRERWQRHHRAIVTPTMLHIQGCTDGRGKKAGSFQAWCEWPASDDPEKFYGPTAEEALTNLATARGWRLWKSEAI